MSAAFTLVAPGLGVSTWRAGAARLAASGAPALAASRSARPPSPTSTGWSAACRRSPACRSRSGDAFVAAATVHDVPAGTRIVEQGDTASSAYFILEGSTTAGIPEPGGGYHGLSTMQPGDFFGEIAALTGSKRTANVVADVDTELLEVPAEALRATLVVPEIQRLVYSTLTSRLLHHRGRRPAAPGRSRPGRAA